MTPSTTRKLLAPIDFAVIWRGAAELLSFETVLLLFLFAGIYKIDPRLAWFPVDLTLFFFVISLALGAVIILREGLFIAGFAVVTAAAVFVGWVALTQTWTPGIDYANEKLTKLATLTFWSLMATATIVASRPERARRFHAPTVGARHYCDPGRALPVWDLAPGILVDLQA